MCSPRRTRSTKKRCSASLFSARAMVWPTIIASGTILGLDVVKSANWSVARDWLIAAGFAFLAALLALSFMMRLLRSVSFTPYVIYRVILGIVLLVYAYS